MVKPAFLPTPVECYRALPVVFATRSRKLRRKRYRQWRRASQAKAREIFGRFSRVYPEVAVVLGLARVTASQQASVLGILDTAPLNLQGTSPFAQNATATRSQP